MAHARGPAHVDTAHASEAGAATPQAGLATLSEEAGPGDKAQAAGRVRREVVQVNTAGGESGAGGRCSGGPDAGRQVGGVSWCQAVRSQLSVVIFFK